jgi:nucleoside-diphosphate-sugar epimerase
MKDHMRVFVAGATGAMGRPLVRLLAAQGHDVIGMTRSAERGQLVAADGGRPVVADALDAAAVRRVVAAATPTHLVHLLTALPPNGPLRPGGLAATNRLRVEGTRHLLEAARAAGVHRVVAESFAAVYGPMPATVAALDERVVLAPVTHGPLRDTVMALRRLEAQLAEVAERRLTTVVLRFGGIMGAGVPSTDGLLRQARAGRLFAPPDAGGLFSYVHVDDAARAVLAALEHPRPGPVYNVADDTPMSIAAVLALASRICGARAPRRVPGWLLRLAAPVAAELNRWRLPLANARIREELGWRPHYRTPEDALRAIAGVLQAAA